MTNETKYWHQCEDCKHYQYESDINYHGCAKEGYITDDEWEGNKECHCHDNKRTIEELRYEETLYQQYLKEQDGGRK